ncbi:HDOD domain-containing protein [Halopseudomonas phragmitis]|nr:MULTISPECIES: HDOD domain-containing protein [Pseudomonadaceae]
MLRQLMHRLLGRQPAPARVEPVVAGEPPKVSHRESPVAASAPAQLNTDLELAVVASLFGLDTPLIQPPNEFEQQALKALKGVLAGDLKDSSLVPRLPSLLPQLMSHFRSPTVSSKGLAEMIGRDLVAVGEVLRVANSSYYRRSKEVTSLEQAVVLLGERGLRQVVANLLVRPIFNTRDGHFGQLAGDLLWRQSERVAQVCAALARAERGNEFHAYLAGICSHLGLMVGCQLLDSRFPRGGYVASELFLRDWLRLGRRLNAGVARAWNFPAGCYQVLEAMTESAQVLAPAADVERLELAMRVCQQQLLATRSGLAAASQEPVNELQMRRLQVARQALERCS